MQPARVQQDKEEPMKEILVVNECASEEIVLSSDENTATIQRMHMQPRNK